MSLITQCKYCLDPVEDIIAEGLQCERCSMAVHLKCLKRGSVPGGLTGDVFFLFTCMECSDTSTETFVRDKMSWLQAIVLVLFHMQKRCPGLARRGFFHWKTHICTFIDKHWDMIFRNDFKRKRKWGGTISGSLSHYSPNFFTSGTSIFGTQGWWTLTYPKLTPKVIFDLNTEMLIEKQKSKECKALPDVQLLKQILEEKPYACEEFLSKKRIIAITEEEHVASLQRNNEPNLKKRHLPTFSPLQGAPIFKKQPKLADYADQLCKIEPVEARPEATKDEEQPLKSQPKLRHGPLQYKFLDPMCHYNTSLRNAEFPAHTTLKAKLTGGIRELPVLSPYSLLRLGPYIRRDTSTKTDWIQLMEDIQAKVNMNKPGWTLPDRAPIDYSYVQPEHIPAINSLCNQFFWAGIDLVDTLNYPDYSCVVHYKRLIVGFAFLVPSVNLNENYLSFIFVRPGWRKRNIAKFMIYHLAQCSMGKDITLHVSISNPALLLYQQCGFKVENVVQNFYDKYMPDDSNESKNAFFCRLER